MFLEGGWNFHFGMVANVEEDVSVVEEVCNGMDDGSLVGRVN